MDSELKIKMYKDMLRIRHFEERVCELFAKGKLPGFYHLYLGEEAVAVGACSAIEQSDFITSTHRGHGHVLAKGADMKKMMAELYAKSTGYNKAKGGSMHLAAPDVGVLGANGIVGAGIPIATGSAFSSKLQKNKKVTLCFFGDGATNQGTFHESLNLASAFNLPCVYICENNLYGVGTRQSDVRKVEHIANRAKAYDIPGVIVDGNDVEAVHNEVKKAVDNARSGHGPTLIECKTYRWKTHFEGEPDTYRSKEEVAEWKNKEPIGRWLKKIEGILTKEAAEEIERDVIRELEDAVEFGETSPFPKVHTALEDVYA